MLRCFCPQLVVPSITALGSQFFRDRGLQAALLDLDNTLVLWHGTTIEPEIADWIRRMKDGGTRFCLASNTHRPRRLAELGEALGIPYELGVAKPGRAGLHRCLARLGTSPGATAMIGDQLFTDIWGGNRCGLFTILVRPLSPHEFIGTRMVSRPLERVVITELRRRGLIREHLPQETPR